MESFFGRYRNQGVLALLLVGQLMLLGYQVRRPDAGGMRLIRQWGLEATVPVGKTSQRMVLRVRHWWSGYVALRDVRRQNQQLTAQITSLELANQQLRERLREAPAVAKLLQFEGSLSYSTLPAQVIGSGGSPDTQVIYLDRGSQDGLVRNMPVITPAGAVGKVTQVLSGAAQVLLLTDPDSGVGALVEATGVHGVLHGLGAGRAELRYVLDGESIAAGATLITSGEDQVFPKGLPLGTVISATPGPVFQQIAVKTAADLDRLEEVLVVTARVPAPNEAAAGLTAAEIRQAQLPAIPAAASGVGLTPAAAGARPAAGTTAVGAAATIPAPTAAATDTPPAEGDAMDGSTPATPPTAATTAPATAAPAPKAPAPPSHPAPPVTAPAAAPAPKAAPPPAHVAAPATGRGGATPPANANNGRGGTNPIHH